MKPLKATRPVLLIVWWKDACGKRDDDNLKPLDCLSVGWVVELHDEYIKLASELSPDDDTTYQEVVVIPTGMIQKVQEVKVKLPENFRYWTPNAGN